MRNGEKYSEVILYLILQRRLIAERFSAPSVFVRLGLGLLGARMAVHYLPFIWF